MHGPKISFGGSSISRISLNESHGSGRIGQHRVDSLPLHSRFVNGVAKPELEASLIAKGVLVCERGFSRSISATQQGKQNRFHCSGEIQLMLVVRDIELYHVVNVLNFLLT